MTLPYGSPDDRSETERMAREAAEQAAYELRIDGPAPSPERILREMGRAEDGSEIEADALKPSEAPAVARRLL